MLSFARAAFAGAGFALASLAAAWAAAQGPMNPMNGMGQMDPRGYQADPNAAISQTPGAGGGLHDCVDARPRPGPAPKVVRTLPAPGSVVRPGLLVLSVTFDQPMACEALTQSHFPIPCPDGKGAVMLATDRRTLTTVCPVEAGASYSMPLVDFVGAGGARSERYDLTFTTSTAKPVTDARQAMALEKAGAVPR